MKSTKTRNIMPFVKNGAVGGAVGFGVMSVAVFVFALFMFAGVLPEDSASILAVASAFIGSFAGGILAGLRMKRRGLFTGLAVATVLFALLLAVRLIFSESFSPDTELLIIALVSFTGAVCGALLATNLKLSSKNKKFRR